MLKTPIWLGAISNKYGTPRFFHIGIGIGTIKIKSQKLETF